MEFELRKDLRKFSIWDFLWNQPLISHCTGKYGLLDIGKFFSSYLFDFCWYVFIFSWCRVDSVVNEVSRWYKGKRSSFAKNNKKSFYVAKIEIYDLLFKGDVVWTQYENTVCSHWNASLDELKCVFMPESMVSIFQLTTPFLLSCDQAKFHNNHCICIFL